MSDAPEAFASTRLDRMGPNRERVGPNLKRLIVFAMGYTVIGAVILWLFFPHAAGMVYTTDTVRLMPTWRIMGSAVGVLLWIMALRFLAMCLLQRPYLKVSESGIIFQTGLFGGVRHVGWSALGRCVLGINNTITGPVSGNDADLKTRAQKMLQIPSYMLNIEPTELVHSINSLRKHHERGDSWDLSRWNTAPQITVDLTPYRERQLRQKVKRSIISDVWWLVVAELGSWMLLGFNLWLRFPLQIWTPMVFGSTLVAAGIIGVIRPRLPFSTVVLTTIGTLAVALTYVYATQPYSFMQGDMIVTASIVLSAGILSYLCGHIFG